MIEVVLNDRLGKKVCNAGQGLSEACCLPCPHERKGLHNVRGRFALQIRVKCNEDDTIGDLKKMVAAQTGAAAAQGFQAVAAVLLLVESAVLSLPHADHHACTGLPAGTRPEKIRIQKWYTGELFDVQQHSMCAGSMHGTWRPTCSGPPAPGGAAVYKDHITLSDYE
jgi:hypothetical protein